MRAKKLSKLYILYLKALNKLQSRILICYVAQDFLNKNFYYERKIYQARLRLFTIMKKIRFIVEQKANSHLSALENLYEIVFSLNILKLRASDPSVFEICRAEIERISRSFSIALQKMGIFIAQQEGEGKKISLENVTDTKTRILLDNMAKAIGQFSQKIDAFEEVYRSTLQVVTPEPIFFLFFLQNLMALRESLESFFLGLLNDGSL